MKSNEKSNLIKLGVGLGAGFLSVTWYELVK